MTRPARSGRRSGWPPSIAGATRVRLSIERKVNKMKRNLNCPCGETIVGTDEDDLVAKTQAHLAENHPGHEYSRDEILFIAY
jgi:hypothetical protein